MHPQNLHDQHVSLNTDVMSLVPTTYQLPLLILQHMGRALETLHCDLVKLHAVLSSGKNLIHESEVIQKMVTICY